MKSCYLSACSRKRSLQIGCGPRPGRLLLRYLHRQEFLLIIERGILGLYNWLEEGMGAPTDVLGRNHSVQATKVAEYGKMPNIGHLHVLRNRWVACNPRGLP